MLAFSTEAVILVEIKIPCLGTQAFDEKWNTQDLRVNLDLVEEIKIETKMRSAVYKQKAA